MSEVRLGDRVKAEIVGVVIQYDHANETVLVQHTSPVEPQLLTTFKADEVTVLLPDVPQLFGAVIEDKDGQRWSRTDSDEEPWRRHIPRGDRRGSFWATDKRMVEVLRAGGKIRFGGIE